MCDLNEGDFAIISDPSPLQMNNGKIVQIVSKETGCFVDYGDGRVVESWLVKGENMLNHFKEIEPEGLVAKDILVKVCKKGD